MWKSTAPGYDRGYDNDGGWTDGRGDDCSDGMVIAGNSSKCAPVGGCNGPRAYNARRLARQNKIVRATCVMDACVYRARARTDKLNVDGVDKHGHIRTEKVRPLRLLKTHSLVFGTTIIRITSDRENQARANDSTTIYDDHCYRAGKARKFRTLHTCCHTELPSNRAFWIYLTCIYHVYSDTSRQVVVSPTVS